MRSNKHFVAMSACALAVSGAFAAPDSSELSDLSLE